MTAALDGRFRDTASDTVIAKTGYQPRYIAALNHFQIGIQRRGCGQQTKAHVLRTKIKLQHGARGQLAGAVVSHDEFDKAGFKYRDAQANIQGTTGFYVVARIVHIIAVNNGRVSKKAFTIEPRIVDAAGVTQALGNKPFLGHRSDVGKTLLYRYAVHRQGHCGG